MSLPNDHSISTFIYRLKSRRLNKYSRTCSMIPPSKSEPNRIKVIFGCWFLRTQANRHDLRCPPNPTTTWRSLLFLNSLAAPYNTSPASHVYRRWGEIPCLTCGPSFVNGGNHYKDLIKTVINCLDTTLCYRGVLAILSSLPSALRMKYYACDGEHTLHFYGEYTITLVHSSLLLS